MTVTPEITVRTEVTGAYKGQINGNVVAFDKTGKQAGILQYQQFEDEVLIAWIEVSPEMQKRGIATRLYQELQNEWPDKKITWGMTTPEGTALRKGIEKEVTVPVAEPTAKAEADKVKEPWEMAQKEWIDGHIKSPAMHWEHVRIALTEGKPVPPEVLAEYPDLQKAKPAVPTRESIIELDRKHTLPELQGLCRQKGLSTSGDKKTLVRRLF